MNNRVIRDYLESLKEDDELDYIFPILLESMGFRVVATPRNSKGQPQFGKDVVAIGLDENGVKHRWFFELKGNAAKDIDDRTFNCKDGLRESLYAALDADYSDSSIPGFNSLPVKIVFVHNGILKENTRVQFNGFIKKHFIDDNFERWGIEKLTNLFYKFLFDECLYRDNESYSLVKRILVMYDAPGWEPTDFGKLVDVQLKNCIKKISNRKLSQHFSAVNLLLAILYKEGKEINNLLPVKRCSDVAVLKVWSWILENKKNNKKVLRLFSKIVELHLKIYGSYLNKLIPLASQYKGLYMFGGTETERIFYPLRCFDFISDLIYYQCAVRNYIVKENRANFDNEGLKLVLRIIKSNSGFDMPLLDTNSIPILFILKYVLTICEPSEEDVNEIRMWIVRMVSNIIIRKQDSKMFPELYGNRKELAKSLFSKSPNYHDDSSLLLTIFVEILYWMNGEELYNKLNELIKIEDVNLQVSYPIESPDLEVHLFSENLGSHLSVEPNIKLPNNLKDLPNYLKKNYSPIRLITDTTQFYFLKYLAHIYYQTDWFPDFANFGFLSLSEDPKGYKN